MPNAMILHLNKLIAILLLAMACSAQGSVPPYDMIVLIDESSLTDVNNRSVVKATLDRLSYKPDNQNRVGVYAYGERTFESLPLGELSSAIIERMKSPENQSESEAGLKNPAAALEKAIYKLRESERSTVSKVVLVLGDGVISTGDSQHDRQLSQWLIDDLSEAARAADIRIYWLTFTDGADYRIIQTLTSKTQGTYYRAFTPASATEAVSAIVSSLSLADSSAPANQATGEIRESGGEPASAFEGGSAILILAASALLLGLIGGGVYLGRSTRLKAAGRADAVTADDARAFLRDLTGFTAMTEYDITDKKTYIGRLPREVTERSTVIVIRDETVGREHAVIQCENASYWISDSGSVNGTYINNKRITEKQRLLDGDRVRFARFEFEVALPKGESTLTGKSSGAKSSPLSPDPVVEEEDEDRTVYRTR